MTTTADVIVLGLGPGGEQVANDLLSGGLSVIGIEAELVGGECPYWGCIPSKMMIRAGDALTEGEVLRCTGIPSFAPELLRRVKELEKRLEAMGEPPAADPSPTS